MGFYFWKTTNPTKHYCVYLSDRSLYDHCSFKARKHLGYPPVCPFLPFSLVKFQFLKNKQKTHFLGSKHDLHLCMYDIFLDFLLKNGISFEIAYIL